MLTSLVGYSLIWDNVDNRRSPTTGGFLTFHQDFAGLGGQSEFIRETFDGRYYYPRHRRHRRFRQGAGRPDQWLRQRQPACRSSTISISVPDLVRGFAPGGIGPRDISDLEQRLDQRARAERPISAHRRRLQFPLFGTPKELGLKGACLRRRRHAFRLQRADRLHVAAQL